MDALLIGLSILFMVVALIALVVAPIISICLCFGIRRRQSEMADNLSLVRERLQALLAGQEQQPEQAPAAPVVEEQPTAIRPAPIPPPATEPKPVTADRPFPVQLEIKEAAATEPGRFEAAARRILGRIWNWIVVGEEFRRPGVSTEYAVATNWLVRIGVVIVVAGVLFFLDYTSSRGWLGPPGKVAIALLTGSALLAAGIQLLGRRYHLIGQGLLGAGLAVWYAGLFAAANLYGLIGAGTAFFLMACVTVGAGFMAVRFDSLLVAILGLIGGYGTPLALPVEAVNFPGFFGYLLVLGCGVLGIAHRRNWHLLQALAFMATFGLAGTSLHASYTPELFWQVFPFLTAFFIMFSTTVFIYQLRHGRPSSLIDLGLLTLNAMFYFGLVYQLIQQTFAMEWSAMLALGLSAFYTAHLYIFLRRRRQDRGLAIGFTGLAAFFLIITLPLLLSDQWLTLCWSVQALVLLWMALKLDSRFLQHTACALYLIVFVRFFFLDLGGSFRGALPADLSLLQYGRLLLSRLIAFGVPAASLAAAMRLLRRPVASAPELRLRPGNDITPLFAPTRAFVTAGALLFVMIFSYLHLELNRSLLFAMEPLRLPMLSALWAIAALVLARLYTGSRQHALRGLACCFAAGLIVKLLFVDLPYWDLAFDNLLYRPEYRILDAGMRLLDFGVIMFLFLYMFRLFHDNDRQADRRLGRFFGYSSLVLLLGYATFEVNTCLGHFLPGMRTGGLSVFWGFFALGLVTGGLVFRIRPLRFAGLAFFTIVVLKVFFSDLAQLDPLYKIIAFTLLGAVLLTGAFVYLRFEDRFREKDGERQAS